MSKCVKMWSLTPREENAFFAIFPIFEKPAKVLSGSAKVSIKGHIWCQNVVTDTDGKKYEIIAIFPWYLLGSTWRRLGSTWRLLGSSGEALGRSGEALGSSGEARAREKERQRAFLLLPLSLPPLYI